MTKATIENIKNYVEIELLKTLKTEKEFADNEKDCSAYYYLQGIESALISLDEEFDFGINNKLC